MRRRASSQHAFEGINATPLIDVVMCLIVFFLLVGKLAIDRQNELRLPEAASGDTAKAPDKLVINVFPPSTSDPRAAPTMPGWTARVIVEDRRLGSPAELDQIVRAALKERPETVIEVRADRTLPFGAVEPVLKACAAAGAAGVQLATERPL